MRRLLPPRALAATATAAVLLLGFTACNDDKTDQASSGSTPGSSDSSTTETPTSSPTDSGDEEQTSGNGAVDAAALFSQMQDAMFKAGSAHAVMDFGQGVANGDLRFGHGQTAMQLTMQLTASSGATSKVDMRFVDGAFYMAIPGLTPAGKFFKVDSSSKTLGSVIDNLKSMRPDSALAAVRKSVKKIDDAGSEDIDGTPTEHYKLTISTKQAMSLLGSQLPANVPTPSLPKTLTYDFWVTTDHLLRRAVFDVANNTMQLDYTRWGQPVDIKAPPASKVVQAPNGL
jgi:LppX_LprAFG lipoprotein